MKLFFDPVPHAEAVKFLNSRAVVTREVFDELTPELKGLAFVITGIDDAVQLQAAKTILAKLPAGTNFDDVKDQLIAVLPFTGVKAERRAELLLRHWGGIAYAAAQYRIMDRQRDVFPWWQYVNMGDQKVRATHVALGGVILRADSPFWQGHYPPWEPFCRCSVIALTDADVEGIKESEKDLPVDERSVLEGPILDKLLQSGTLIRGINNVHDVRTPAEKGESWIGWDPDNITKGLDLAKVQAQLDPDVWAKLVKFWKGKWVDPSTTVHAWLGKVGKPKPAKAPAPVAATPPPPAPPLVLPGLGTSLWLSPDSWPKPKIQLPGNPTTLWLDPAKWPKPKFILPGLGTSLWLDPKKWPKKPRKPRAKKAVPTVDASPVAPGDAAPAILTTVIPSPDLLTPFKKLGGTTGAELRKAPDGSLWVVKKGNSAAHVREEFLADQLYAAAGVRVPPAQIFETPAGPVKVAQFIAGKTLAEWQRETPAAQQADTLRQIREAFAVDALLGNWDVAGQGNDNLLIDEAGQPWRIDNGGSLRFRAQGRAKTPQEWQPEVRDLRTMRETSSNPQTARLFAGLTDDEIAAQVETRLLPARDGLLSLTAGDPAVRGMLEARLDWMRRTLVPYTEEEIAAISAAGIRGHTQLGDEDGVEDLTVLHWVEKDAAGADVTRVRLKLTEAGSAALVATVGSQLATPAGPSSAPTDAYWQEILPVLKHVGAHAASDKVYNPAKLAILTGLATKLASEKDSALAAHYLAQIAKIADAAATHTPPAIGSLNPYVQPPKAAPAVPASSLGIKSINYAYTAKDLDGNKARNQGTSIWTNHAYQVDRPEASLSFVPWKLPNGTDSPAPYALRGYVDLVVPGLPDKATLRKAQALLKEVGLDVTAAPAARRELLYLQKGLRLAKPSDSSWQAIAAGPGHDFEKVDALKKWISAKLSIDLPAAGSPGYEPDGRAGWNGNGWRTFERWDQTPEQITAALPGYGLTHQTSSNLGTVFRAWLANGGQVSNTVERLRTGIAINSGMSPTTDLGTGGANYFFTRINSNPSSFSRGFIFKIGSLARMDAISYGGDYFGNVTPSNTATRATDPAGWKAFSRNGSNETIFKNGLDLLRDLEAIRCTAAEEKTITKALKDAGILQLPDGRPVSDLFKK